MSSNRLLSTGIGLAATSLMLAACGSSNAGNAGARSTPSNTAPISASPTASMSASPSTSASISASPTVSTKPQVPPCSSNIRVIKGGGQGAAGHITLVLIFNNVGTTACKIYGYPGVDLVSASGKVIAHAQRALSGMAGGATSLAAITLAPGKSASALLEASDVPQGSITDCGSYNLNVTPPGQYVAVPLATAMMPKCDVQIHPVVAGTGGGMR